MLANINDAGLRSELKDIQGNLPTIYRYIIARSLTTSDVAACRTIGFTYQWLVQQENKEYYNNLAERLACDRLLQAGLSLQELLPNAIEKLGELLNSNNERIKLQASIAILDRVGIDKAVIAQQGNGQMKNLADVIMNVYGNVVNGEVRDSGGGYIEGEIVDG